MNTAAERTAYAAYRRMGGRSLTLAQFVIAYKASGSGAVADVMSASESRSRFSG